MGCVCLCCLAVVSIKGGHYKETERDFLATLISGVFGAAVEMGKILIMEDLEVLQYESKSMDVVIKFIPPRFLLGVIVEEGDPCPKCGASLKVRRGLELGHNSP